MPPSDSDLLRFDRKRMPNFKLAKARRTLAGRHGGLYRNHLVVAHFIDGWRERTLRPRLLPRPRDWQQGFEYAMREVAAHLRQGDFLPGGILHDEQVSGKFERDEVARGA
jgi:hypothetical protein